MEVHTKYSFYKISMHHHPTFTEHLCTVIIMKIAGMCDYDLLSRIHSKIMTRKKCIKGGKNLQITLILYKCICCCKVVQSNVWHFKLISFSFMQFNTLYFWLLLLTEVKQVHSNKYTCRLYKSNRKNVLFLSREKILKKK